ncbi:hypothetical protein C0583_04745 [Candidatus Parcubacteria bacterium]|nr:MAG: hypothetical protein C0583_04745 [Candidatus Parcubacteria bacterium]
MDNKNPRDTRPIDEAVKESYSWLGRSYVFIAKTKIKTWQSVFVLAFLVGAALATIFLVSADFQTSSYASTYDLSKAIDSKKCYKVLKSQSSYEKKITLYLLQKKRYCGLNYDPANPSSAISKSKCKNVIKKIAKYEKNISALQPKFDKYCGFTTTPVVTFSNLASDEASYTSDQRNILLFKGRISANEVSDLQIKSVNFQGIFGGGTSNDSFSDAFDRLSLYYIDGNGDEVLLDNEASLETTSVKFTGTMTIPANGTVAVVVRADVKTLVQSGTYALKWADSTTNYSVIDEDNTALPAEQYEIDSTTGTIFNITSTGSYSIEFDTTESYYSNNRNVLAGGLRPLGKLLLSVQNENAILEDLVIQAITDDGSEEIFSDDTQTLYLFTDNSMTDLLANADFGEGANPKALFEDIDFLIPTDGITYLYIYGLVKSIDYSNSPSADSTAQAGKYFHLAIPNDEDLYTRKVIGANTGQTLKNEPVATVSKSSTIMGAIITAVSSDFSNDTLTIGKQDIFSFKVTAPNSTNIDYDGDLLGVKLAQSTFTLNKTDNISFEKFWIERVGGANGEKQAFASTTAEDKLYIDFAYTYGNENDLVIEPGTTAEFILRGFITPTNSLRDETLQVTIENMQTNFNYSHNIGEFGSYTGQTERVFTKIPGLTNIKGGSLSN